MAVTYSTAVKTARMEAVVAAIGASGKLVFMTSADAVICTFTLAATAGTVTAGVLTFSDANGGTAGILNTTGSANGVVAKAKITTSANLDIITGFTVGTSSADFIIDNTNVAVGQSVTVTSASITHAA